MSVLDGPAMRHWCMSELCATCWMVDCEASVRMFRDSKWPASLLHQDPEACAMPERSCIKISALQCRLAVYSALYCSLDPLTALSHKR